MRRTKNKKRRLSNPRPWHTNRNLIVGLIQDLSASQSVAQVIAEGTMYKHESDFWREVVDVLVHVQEMISDFYEE